VPRGNLISRRAFLSLGPALGLLRLLPPSLVGTASGNVPGTRADPGEPSLAIELVAAPPARLTRSSFAPLLGSPLRMTGGGDNLNVVLTDIRDLPQAAPNDEDRFVLTFRAPPGRPRTQGIRTFEHHSIRHVGVFVAAVDRGVNGLSYEAVFNRL
jgi:hypothetical protein